MSRCRGENIVRTGIQISGDTVIRLLLKHYESQPASVVRDMIGIDDFTYKKRHVSGSFPKRQKSRKISILQFLLSSSYS